MEHLRQTGRIFDLQRFSVHDGPGVRTIVFCKGCRLHCKWCCNPEGQRYEIETMQTQDGVKTVGRDVTVAELLPELLRDRPYYRRSGGGVTLSGGEVLTQPAFAAALLRACREAGLTTAIETTGCAPFGDIESLLPYLDDVLMDIKHIDSAKHQAFTGKPNALMLENAARIAASGRVRLTVRVPVVPTFNDTRAEIAAIARFAAGLPNVKAVHLLPYHRMGRDKYKGLGRAYELEELRPPTAEQMNALCAEVTAAGLYCQIGG